MCFEWLHILNKNPRNLWEFWKQKPEMHVYIESSLELATWGHVAEGSVYVASEVSTCAEKMNGVNADLKILALRLSSQPFDWQYPLLALFLIFTAGYMWEEFNCPTHSRGSMQTFSVSVSSRVLSVTPPVQKPAGQRSWMLPPYATAWFKPFKFSTSVEMQGFAYSSVLRDLSTCKTHLCLHLSSQSSGSSFLWSDLHLNKPNKTSI